LLRVYYLLKRRAILYAILLVILLAGSSRGIYEIIHRHMKRKHSMSRYPLASLNILRSRGVIISNVLDVGAHSAGWSTELREYALPDAKFFMIEGNRGWEPTLKKSGIPYRITLVGDAEKDVTFFKLCESGGCSGGNSIFREASQWGTSYKNVTEHMLTIDQVVKLESLGVVDMIKMDIQGAELLALKGATDTLKTCKVILLEISTVPLYPQAPLLVESLVFLEKLGFKLFSVPDVMNRNGMTISVDVFFVRADLPEIWDNPPWN